MARLFSSRAFCAKCIFLRTQTSPSSTLRAVAPRNSAGLFTQQQQRRFAGDSNCFGSRRKTKAWLWLCGAGAGFALAVGLNYQNDAVNTSCENKKDRPFDRYSDARKVSRDLVERIKVSSEVRMGRDALFDSLGVCILVWIPHVCAVHQAEVGAPGVVVGVSVDGSLIWSEGLYLLYSPLLCLYNLFSHVTFCMKKVILGLRRGLYSVYSFWVFYLWFSRVWLCRFGESRAMHTRNCHANRQHQQAPHCCRCCTTV